MLHYEALEQDSRNFKKYLQANDGHNLNHVTSASFHYSLIVCTYIAGAMNELVTNRH